VSSVLNAIPAVANAVTTSYINDGAVTAAKMAASGAWAPAGTVIQVVQGTYSTFFSTTSTSYVDTGLSTSITPTSSSSKILILINQMGYLRLDASTEQGGYANLVRNSTQITEILSYQRMGGSSAQYASYFNGIVYLDSPNTTSSTTYKTQTKVESAGSASQISFNNGSTSTITLVEISA
jgi:hypothetical protein